MGRDPEVQALLDVLLAGIRDALGDDLVGVYLRGSLALGGFDPATSDIDLLVVVERPVDDAGMHALADLHARIARGANRYADRLEVSYVDRAAIRRFRADERRHPSIGTDWPFGRHDHRDNWSMERRVVREHGVALVGPDPRTLIDPVTDAEVNAAVRAELRSRLSAWAWDDEPPAWLLPRYYQAFEVETMCRALHTLRTGELSTKRAAVDWALANLPEPWTGLVRGAVAHRADATPERTAASQVMRFVRWVSVESGAVESRGAVDAQEEGGAQAGT